MMKAIRIKGWKVHFEKADNRKLSGPWRWVPMPIKHDGKGWRRLCALKNAVSAALGFMLCVEVAAKMPVRGLLADEDGPLDANELAIQTGMPSGCFADAIDVMTDQEVKINWFEWVEIELVEDPNDSSQPLIPRVVRVITDHPHPDAVRTPSRLHNSTEQDITEPLDASASCSEPASTPTPEPSDSTPPVLVFPTVRSRRSDGTEWKLTQEKLKEYSDTYTIDALFECKKALQWLRDNPEKIKTTKGMPKFLNGWLNRAQDRGGSNGPRGAVPHETDVQQRARKLIESSQ